MQVSATHQHWSSRFAFIMASVGAAVGLGNFWRFPYQAGENGGGAFVLIYLAVVVLVCIPLAMSELLIGRRGQSSAIGSVRAVARAEGKSGIWAILAWMGMISSFLVLTYYSVIAGWVMAYIPKAAMPGAFSSGAEAVGEQFGALVSDPVAIIGWHTLFMAITIWIVSRGLNKGIERAATILMPAFFIMLLFVVFYAMSAGDVPRTLEFLFTPRWEQVNVSMLMAAIAQAFFSVGVGAAILITYGAYLHRDAHLPRSSILISFTDTGVAILAGLAIFPLVFANEALSPGQGPGLLFVTLPLAFADVPMAQVFGTVFFSLAFFAALTSSIALLEITISWAEENLKMTRRAACLVFGLIAWAFGLTMALSFNVWDNTLPGQYLPGVEDRNFFGVVDFFATKVMLPLGGVLVAVFAGWIVSRESAVDELGISGAGFRLWRFLVRFLIPIVVGLVLILNTAQMGFGVDLLARVGLNGG